MVCWGDFSGGYLALPDLRVKLDFKPGDIIFFRSRLLEHFITDFEGERSNMVFFTHENVLKYGMEAEEGDKRNIVILDLFAAFALNPCYNYKLIAPIYFLFDKRPRGPMNFAVVC